MERYNIINYRNSLYTFDSSYSGLTFRNIGKLFDDSVMSEPISSLPEDVRQRWEYAAYLAKKHGLHISYNLIYTTTGRPDELYEIREKISKTMFVSPIMWIPLKNCGSLSSVRSLNNTYGFGFFPYAERRPFIYDDSVDR